MTQAEIPPAEWGSFCDAFTRQHHGWRVTVGIIATALLDTEAAGVPGTLLAEAALDGLTWEPATGTLELSVRLEGGAQHAHPIPAPVRLLFEQTPDGAHKGLRIDAGEAHTTLLRFRAPAAPEALDGLTEYERP